VFGLPRKRKRKKKPTKEDLSELLNTVLDTDIDFTKLSYDELEELVQAIERLIEEKEKGFDMERLNRLRKVLAEVGVEILSNWKGPIVTALREIFKTALEKEEKEED